METRIAFCFVAICIAYCQGLWLVGNVGGKTASTYKVAGRLGVSGGENDTGIGISGKAGADHYAAANVGVGAQIGGNGEKSGKGLAVGVRSSLKGGAHAGAEVAGNWYDKKIEGGGNIGADGALDNIGANIGVYYEAPDLDYNPWDHIGKYRKRRGAAFVKN